MYNCSLHFTNGEEVKTDIRHWAAGEVINEEYFSITVRNENEKTDVTFYLSTEQMRKFRDDVHFGMTKIESEVGG